MKKITDVEHNIRDFSQNVMKLLPSQRGHMTEHLQAAVQTFWSGGLWRVHKDQIQASIGTALVSESGLIPTGQMS